MPTAKTVKHALPESRDEALKEGELFFFTGLPCRNGHISKRYTTSGGCFQCLQEKHEADSKARAAFRETRKRKLEMMAKASREEA